MPDNEIIKRQLPDIQNLYADVEVTAKNNELNILLNQNPKKEWIKVNKFANNSNYIPIAVVEYLLTSIFAKWRVEVKEVKMIANSCVVVIRLHYLDPVTGTWDWQDGIGAAPIQTSSGSSAADFSNVTTSAVQMAAPAAESYAIKDAAEKLGKLFGKDLNRKDLLDIQGMLHKKKNKFEDNQLPSDEERLHKMMRACTTEPQLEIFKRNLKTAKDRSLYDDLLQKITK